jgi:serine phosphatase RsbU (regulator of sigma subunit)
LAAVLDRRSSTLTIANAGHPAPLLRRRNGSVQVIGESSRGVALGLMAKRRYPEVTVALEPGDIWLAFTDGFTEAANAKDEMFGTDRLCQGLATAPAVVREASDRIVREVQSFLGDQAQSDDMCLVALTLLDNAVATTSDFRVQPVP